MPTYYFDGQSLYYPPEEKQEAPGSTGYINIGILGSGMVAPSSVPGEYDVFVSGDGTDAKAQVSDILENLFGWKSVIGLGDVTTARDP